MIRGKLQEGIRTMFSFHVRRNSTDSPNTLTGASTKWVETPRSNLGGSPRTEVGEIDTSAPFQSVKAAVSLFGEAGTSPRAAAGPNKPLVIKKPKTADDQRVLEKETQIHLALKELEDFKERLKNTEATKAQALLELEKANRTLQELTNKLEIVSESKQTAIESAEAAKQRAQEIEEQKFSQLGGGGGGGGAGGGGTVDAWKKDVDSEREQYRVTSVELISAKQELTMLRQDFDGVLEAKLAAFQQAADAQHVTQVNQERIVQISKEITSLQETLRQVKQATLEAQQLQNHHNAEREARLLSHSRAREELDLKIKSLKEENDPQPRENLEEKLEEATEAIKVLEEQLKNVRDSDMSSLKNVTEELDDAKNELEEIAKGENRQRSSVDLLKLELDTVRRVHCEMNDKTTEAESRVQILQAELERQKIQLEAGGVIDPDQVSLCDDLNLQLQQLALESENARQEIEEIRKSIAVLRGDTETAYIAAREAEERLEIVLNEVEEAKAAERHAGDMIHHTSSNNDPQDMSSRSSTNGKIKLSVEEFECLSKKAEESRADADLKVATIMAQIESIKASETEALKKMEAFRIEKEAMESAIGDALKQVEMAEAAKQVVEGELMKWRQRESFTS